MRRAGSVAAGALALGLLASGCGGENPAAQRTLSDFFKVSPRGRAWGKRFPHAPGSVPCTVKDAEGKPVPATCSTDVSLVEQSRAVVILTETWNRGARARTWFVFVRRDGRIQSVVPEAVPVPSQGR
jgi:hypothetical protein